MVNLSKLYNPYDFANPISDSDLFIGRKKELDEIEYYLDHAKTSPRPINIAVLGPRASGKTSVLNMCELGAKKRGFCTVRIDLDEGDAETQLSFFYKLFDGIFSTVCELGGFEGKEGKTYDTYLDIMNTYIIPEDKTFCPFLFPLQYAKAFGSGNFGAPLSDHNYRKDLQRMQSEIDISVVVLFDEGNTLAGSRVHLEKIRNIFMNTPGFMLVFSGTPDLFPIIDDVFSPIVRQFKKISIDKFEDVKETKDCIRKPLAKLGIDPDEVFNFRRRDDVLEIHELSSGRPYEVQLICHMLFRRVQEKRADMMKLDLGVLEEVRRELETSQDITIRPILSAVRNLKSAQLSKLKLLTECDGRANFDQIWALEYIARGEDRWNKKELHVELEHLKDIGVLEIINEKIHFLGDDFDRIYTKYFALEREVTLGFPDFSLEVYFHTRLREIIMEIHEDLNIMDNLLFHDAEVDMFNLTSRLQDKGDKGDVFVESPMVIKDLYDAMIVYRFNKVLPVLELRLTLPWMSCQAFCYCSNADRVDLLEKLLPRIEDLAARAEEVNGKLELIRIELPVVPSADLAGKVEKSANKFARKLLSIGHMISMIEAYVSDSNVEAALFHGNLCFRYEPDPEAYLCNNLGYMYMAADDLKMARYLLEKAIAISEEVSTLCLATYNLGILEAKSGNLKEAVERVRSSVEKAKGLKFEEKKCACLFVPGFYDGALKFEEDKEEPDLVKTAEMALEVLESVTL